MTSAVEKNRTSIELLTGNSAFSSRLETCRIGIWSSHDEKRSGCLFSEALGEFLGRFWIKIDASGTYATRFLQTARKAAESCNNATQYEEKWNPPYDFIISLGSDVPAGCGPGLNISAAGWDVCAGSNSFTDDPNPVGPYAGAALASAESFKTIFRDTNIGESVMPMPENFKWSTWYGKFDRMENLPELRFDDTHVFGIGAVCHGFFWLLKNWPAKVSGAIHLIDQDKYDVSNAQRYIGMRKEDIGKSKSETMAMQLKEKHRDLDATGYAIDMNRYYSEKKPNCKVSIAISGLDSIEMRKQLALKLPKNIINMWTSNLHLGSSRFGFGYNQACLFCAYPEDKKEVPDETAFIHRLTNLPPRRVRELLYSGEGLAQNDSSVVASRISMDVNSIMGKPLRSVVSNACATGIIQMPSSSEPVNIPLVFVSGLSGMGGFVETVRELNQITSCSGAWQMMITKYPTEMNWQPYGKMPECYLCSDSKVLDIVKDKYL